MIISFFKLRFAAVGNAMKNAGKGGKLDGASVNLPDPVYVS